MLAVSSTTAMGFAPVTAPVRQPRADVRMETMSDLDALAQKLNPKVGFLHRRALDPHLALALASPSPRPHPKEARPASLPAP